MGHDPGRVVAGEPPEHRPRHPGPARAGDAGAVARHLDRRSPRDRGGSRARFVGLRHGHRDREDPGTTRRRDWSRDCGGLSRMGANRAHPCVRLQPRLDPRPGRPVEPEDGQRICRLRDDGDHPRRFGHRNRRVQRERGAPRLPTAREPRRGPARPDDRHLVPDRETLSDRDDDCDVRPHPIHGHVDLDDPGPPGLKPRDLRAAAVRRIRRNCVHDVVRRDPELPPNPATKFHRPQSDACRRLGRGLQRERPAGEGPGGQREPVLRLHALGRRQFPTPQQRVRVHELSPFVCERVERPARGPDRQDVRVASSRLRVVPGDRIRAFDAMGRSVNLTIVGVLEQALQFTSGVFVDQDVVRAVFPAQERYTAYFFQMAPTADVGAFRADLERVFFPYGLRTIDIREEIGQAFDASQEVLTLMEAYLGIGLLVGIAGLAVITLRAVVERRTQIGALRAIGFTRRMVLSVFLIEIALIAVLGVGIGVALGIVFAYKVYLVYFADIIVFRIPWDRLLLIVGVASIAAIASTAQPAIRASRIPPAEALRYIE
ncbi:MAG: ABC transporter permease [Chloroflexi bacterium]|nr:MAG: ABC transporter permease [Chloroflexota bacterium]